MRYSIDTSTLIWAWRFTYPPARFPTVWARLEALIQTGDLRASPMVLAELERGDDDLYRWARRQTELYVEPDEEEQRIVRDIVNEFRGLVQQGEDRVNADPFVIALAIRHNLAVVSQEKASGPGGQQKIPNVCAARRVRCFDILGLFEDCGWTF